MKLTKLMVAVLFAALAPLAVAAGATKIAVLDLQAAVLMSEAGKGQMDELGKNPEYSSLKAKIDNFESDLKNLDEQLKSEGLTWGEDKKEEHINKMSEIARQRQAVAGQLGRVNEQAFMQLLNAMKPGISAILEEIMAKEGIEMVLDSNVAITKVQTADITQMVIERLNKMNDAAKENAQKGKQ